MSTNGNGAAIRNRVKELRMVPASQLLAHPANWRLHPDSQRRAMRATLQELGYADALIARETPEGLQLIDGHLRKETTPDALVPVLVVDLDEHEAAKLLATLDPIAAMAEADRGALREVMDKIQTENDGFAKLIEMIGNRDCGPSQCITRLPRRRLGSRPCAYLCSRPLPSASTISRTRSGTSTSRPSSGPPSSCASWRVMGT